MALRQMDTHCIHKRMTKTYDDLKVKTLRVHAELIVLDQFYRGKYEFFQGDKYIGCSKPACYCCFHYIQAHPGNFVPPASHNKLYLNWRPPDIVVPEGSSIEMEEKQQRNIMIEMLKKIRRDVLDQIDTKRGPGGMAPHDSTTGISVSVVAQHLGLLTVSKSKDLACESFFIVQRGSRRSNDYL
jgi:hypothetical protein